MCFCRILPTFQALAQKHHTHTPHQHSSTAETSQLSQTALDATQNIIRTQGTRRNLASAKDFCTVCRASLTLCVASSTGPTGPYGPKVIQSKRVQCQTWTKTQNQACSSLGVNKTIHLLRLDTSRGDVFITPLHTPAQFEELYSDTHQSLL